MRRFQFGIDGVTKDHLRRWRRISESSAVTTKIAAVKTTLAVKASFVAIAAVAVFYGVQRYGGVWIEQPASGTVAHQRTVSVRGTVPQDWVRTVALRVNDAERVVPVRDRVFRAEVQLKDGRNTMQAVVQRTAVGGRSVSNIVRVFFEELDEHGNPVGTRYGLAVDGEFEGKVLLAWSNYHEVLDFIFRKDNPLWSRLRTMGFDVQMRRGRFDPKWLSAADQLWIFSGNLSSDMGPDDYDAIARFAAESRKGVYVLADNEPYIVEASSLSTRLFDSRISGNSPGARILDVSGGQHALLTDVNFIYEGVTVAQISPTTLLAPVLRGSSGEILAAVASDRELRVVVDCAYTRYFYDPAGRSGVRSIEKTAGTLRFAENVAAYLMGKNEK